jgi:exodeoxyribonuclease V alpha subunit
MATHIQNPSAHFNYMDLASFACGIHGEWIEPLAKLLEASARGVGHLTQKELNLTKEHKNPPRHLIVFIDELAMLAKTASAWHILREYFAGAVKHNTPHFSDAMVKKGLDDILGFKADGDNFNNTAQRRAIAALVDAKVGVLTGGPGTGKTTTVAALMALLLRCSPELTSSDIVICAPTGKAANRLRQSLAKAAQHLPLRPEEKKLLEELVPSTIHRALKWNGRAPEVGGPFKYGRYHPLPQQFVLVDEVSMVDVTLMSQLVEALDPEAKLILLGDADQLDSVEAGGVLAELVQRGAAIPHAAQTKSLHARCPEADPKDDREGLPEYTGAEGLPGLSWGLVHSYRAKSAPWILELAQKCRPGKAVSVEEFMATCEVWSCPLSAPIKVFEHVQDFYELCQQAWNKLLEASASWSYLEVPTNHDMEKALGEFQLLCALNHQVTKANQLAVSMHGHGELCHGFPLVVEENRPDLGIVNGDIGIALGAGLGQKALVVAFPGLDLPIPISHLPQYRLAFAMTIHKSQGSEWKTVAIDIPHEPNELLEPRLLYTAITRASEGLVLHAPRKGLEAMLTE